MSQKASKSQSGHYVHEGIPSYAIKSSEILDNTEETVSCSEAKHPFLGVLERLRSIK